MDKQQRAREQTLLSDIDIANKAVEENLNEDGTTKWGTAQGYACALSALRIAAALPDEQTAQGEATLCHVARAGPPLAPPAGPAVEELEKKLKRAWRTATDRQYMIDHLVQMLGPKGREVWKAWQEQGLQRIHVSWGPDAAGMDGEQIAQLHLDMNEAAKNAQPIDDVDAHLATSLDGLLNNKEKRHAQ